MDKGYSALIYEKRISKNTYEKIKTYITKGIKVYFLTECRYIEIEDYVTVGENDNLILWKEKGMLFVNENILLSNTSDFIVMDGKLPEAIKDKLKVEGKFNIEQYCIEHASVEKHIVVTAGAGTGKTKTMIDRVLYLVMTGHAKFSEIVMIAFTNEAANEMKRKLAERL